MPDPRLSPKQELSIAHATARVNVWSGAVRSGKTIASLLRWLIYVANAPRGGQLIVGGKTFDTVARNVFGPLMDPAITGPAAKLIHYTRGAPTAAILGRTVEIITANDSRAENRLRGMTCAGAYVDEATLVPEAYWTQLLARLSVPGAKLFATTNPDNPSHWLRKKFLLRAGELNLRHWHFTLDDNQALDPSYVASLKQEYTGLWFKRFIEGLWVVAEGAVYDMWDPDRHVVDLMPQMWRWVALGVDYGTSNAFSGILLGVHGDNLYAAGEWRHDAKVARRSLTDEEYSQRLRAWVGSYRPSGAAQPGVWPEMVAVDPSAASFVQQLFRDGWSPTPADNAVSDGIRLVSTLLASGRLKVHRSCKGLIEEFPGYSWDDKKAQRGIDAPIKVDDHCLATGTLVTTGRGSVPIETVVPGDMALTRTGWRRVTDAWQVSPSTEVLTLHCSDGTTLTGTPNHRVWTSNRGWVRLDSLRYADKLVTCPHQQKQSFSEESDSVATPTRSVGQTGCTSLPASPTSSAASDGCTRKSGRPTTDRSPKGITSTTPTTIPSTTTSATLCACLPLTTFGTTPTARRSGCSPSSGTSTWPRSDHWPPNGTGRTRGANGTAPTASSRGNSASPTNDPAINADRTTTPGPSMAMSGSVLTPASPLPGARPVSMTSRACACTADQSSGSTGTARPGPAPVSALRVVAQTERQPVYDLTVDGEHEFFANGILVHNSLDALRYAIKTAEYSWRNPQMPTPVPTRASDDGIDFASVAF